MRAGLQDAVPPQLSAVVMKHGRDMVALVYGAGMAGEAAKVLGQEVRSAKTFKALTVLTEAYNQISTSYAAQRGWTEEMLLACERDVELAFAGAVVGEAPLPKIILTGE